MKHKILYKEFLKTFSEKQNKDIEDYHEVLKLHKKGLSMKDIKKITKVSRDRLHQWRNTKIKPVAIKILIKAKDRGYFKTISKKKSEILAYLIGYNLGDGNISRNLCNTWFYGVNTDLVEIKTLISNFQINPVIYTYKINNGKMAIHDHVFSRLLICLGAISGDKTMSKVRVPKWILKSKKASEIKKKFLQGFFDSELSEIKKEKNKISAHKSLKLYTSKHKDHIKEGEIFLNQIRSLLNEFNIVSSEVKKDRLYIRGRDKSEMQQLFFMIYSNYINLFNFIKYVGFLHNEKRVKSSKETLNRIKPLVKKELEKIKKYEIAIVLRKKGLSAYKIADQLNIEIYHIKNWIYFNRKPNLYNFTTRVVKN
tara:strand:- start:925 stop:2025 length:1101 start_codon:yes stop_codon:yes gene_type:complete